MKNQDELDKQTIIEVAEQSFFIVTVSFTAVFILWTLGMIIEIFVRHFSK